MKIHFITDAISKLTGGCIYDGKLYEKLKERFGDDVRLFDYAWFHDDYAFLKRDFLQYGMNYRKHADEIFDCDYLFVNTSMYAKFAQFPWRVKEKYGCRLIGITHHMDYMSYNDWTQGIRKKLLISLMSHCDRLITPNPYTIACMKPFHLDGRAILIEAYLDNTTHLDAQKKEKLVCFVGTIEPRKGVDLGVRAFAQFHETHPEYRFVAAGSFMSGYSKDPYCESLLKLVSDLGLEGQVEFAGRIDDAEKFELYDRSSIFLFPSLLEGYGWVMVEAMGYGMPVIAFDNSAMPYTVNESNGILVPNRDTDAMAQALCRLADDPKLYQRLSEGALRTAAALPDEEAINREYEALMDQMEKGAL